MLPRDTPSTYADAYFQFYDLRGRVGHFYWLSVSITLGFNSKDRLGYYRLLNKL